MENITEQYLKEQRGKLREKDKQIAQLTQTLAKYKEALGAAKLALKQIQHEKDFPRN